MRDQSFHSYRRVAGALAALFLAAACQQTPPPPKPTSPDVWAVVDGREIRRDDVEKAYRGTVQPTAPPPSEAEVLTAKLAIVDQLITQDILVARAKALGIEATDAEVENAFTERKGSNDEVFQQELTKRGLTADDLKRGLRRELTVQKVVDRDVVSKIAVTDQEVTDFYNQNRAQFNLAEPQYRLAQIVIGAGKNPQVRNRLNDDAGTADEARRKLEMLTERLRGGTDFAALASDYSEDPQSAPQGGDLGFLPASALNRLSPLVRDAVLKMQPGSVSTLTAGSSYTILLLVSREQAGQRDLNTPGVRDGIRDMLRNRTHEVLNTAYLAAARNDAKIANHLARQLVDGTGKLSTTPPAAPGKD